MAGATAASPATAVECTTEHTRILRVMLSVDDCAAYLHAPALGSSDSERINDKERVKVAFEQRWFGSKSESRVKTLLGDMSLRFNAYPDALAALRIWKPGRELMPWICHLHTQLADPIYRQFSGEFLPQRLRQGYAQVDREVVARWVQEQWPGRWSAATCIKFGGNLLSTATDTGLLRERKDPRKTMMPRPPLLAIEYLLYLLRGVKIATPLLQSPYLHSVAPTQEAQADCLNSLGAVRLEGMAAVANVMWTYPDLLSWARAQRDASLEASA